MGEMTCAWASALADGKCSASCAIYDRLFDGAAAGILASGFAPGAEADDRNLVLWQCGADLLLRVKVIDGWPAAKGPVVLD